MQVGRTQQNLGFGTLLVKTSRPIDSRNFDISIRSKKMLDNFCSADGNENIYKFKGTKKEEQDLATAVLSCSIPGTSDIEAFLTKGKKQTEKKWDELKSWVFRRDEDIMAECENAVLCSQQAKRL